MEFGSSFLDTTGLDPHLGSPKESMQGRRGCRCRGGHGVSTPTLTHPHHRIHIAPLTLLTTRFTTLQHHNSLWRAVLDPSRSRLLVKPVLLLHTITFHFRRHSLHASPPRWTNNTTKTRIWSRCRRTSKAHRPKTPQQGLFKDGFLHILRRRLVVEHVFDDDDERYFLREA